MVQSTGTFYSILTFGVIPSDNYKVSSQANTTQIGSYTITLKILAANSSIENIVHLTITSSNMQISIQSILVWVAGSAAIVANTAALFFWRQRNRALIPIPLGSKVKKALIAGQYPTEEDQIYLASTYIAQILVIQTTPPTILHFETFKGIERPAALHQTILQLFTRKNKKHVDIANEAVTFQEMPFYLTFLRFPKVNLSISLLAINSIHPAFIAATKSAITLLLQKTPSLRDNPKELAYNLTEILHLNRSYELDLPIEAKVATLEDDLIWKTAFESHEMIAQQN